MEEAQKGFNKKLLWVGGGFTVILAVVLLGSPVLSSRDFTKGIDAFNQGDYANSEKNFKNSILFNPRNPLPHAALGRLALGKEDTKGEEYYPKADWASAAVHYEKALALGLEKNTTSGFYPHTLEHLGHSYLHTGQYEKAREMYLRKIESSPYSFYGNGHFSTFWARFLTAEMDFKFLNQPEEALELLKPIAIPENADPKNLFRVHALLSRLYNYFDDFENTEQHAKLALSSAPVGLSNTDINIRIAHAQLAAVYGKQKKFKTLESEVKNAIAYGMSEADAGCLRAISYFRGGEYSQAVANGKAPAQSVSPYMKSLCLAAAGMSYSELGNTLEAKKYFKDYIDLTESWSEKNIFVARFRDTFSKELSE